MLTPREELLAIQKSLFRHNRRLIQESIVIKEPGFERYEQTYKRSVRNFQRPAAIEEMLRACRRADIVYVGDYHTLHQSQRSFLRILKSVVKKNKNFVIGLELLHKRHQKILDDYLAGKISESNFLEKVGLRKHWVFDLWESFKPIFDFAKYHDAPVLAVDAAPKGADLKARDLATAGLLAKYLRQNQGKKMFVFIGDLHIAPPHLPKAVQEALRSAGIQKKELILYQNSESIYWKLAHRGLEHDTEVVRIDAKSFCRMHTPPVITQRSYLNWLEHEEGELDYADAKHQFMELADRITHFLKIDLGREKEKVEVYTCGDLSFFEKIEKSRRFSKEEIETIKRHIILSESYYISKLRLVYLSNLSINHAAEEAAHFVKHICSGEEKPRHPFDAFYANVLHEALGFFGSKTVNHQRKCYHEADYLKLIKYFVRMRSPGKRHLEYETALLAYQAKMMEKRGEAFHDMELVLHTPDLFFALTHALGYILGDKLYYALLKGVMTKAGLRHLFYDPWKGDGKPFQVYWTLI
ncbi:MAG: ChaN family lipoprotein, partial [Deltaproteobacteria bacterium]|nr:ChaN family lipoprotein [Deltaproteobacteria bacterium]